MAEPTHKNLNHNARETTAALFEIANAVNTTDNLDDLYQSIYRSLNRLIRLPNCFIAIVDKEREKLRFPFFIDEYDTKDYIFQGLENYKESSSNTSQVIISKTPLLMTDKMLKEQRRWKKPIGTSAVIWLGVPLIVRNEVIGVIVVQHYTDPDYFTQKEVDLLMAVSDQVALAIDRKQSQQQIIENEKVTRTLYAISNAVNITDNLDELYQSIYSSLNMLIRLPNFFICILDEKAKSLHFPFYLDEYDTEDNLAFTADYSIDTNYISADVIRTKKPVFLTKPMLEKRAQQGRMVGTVPAIWLGVPLMIRNRVIGVMAVQHYHDPDYFNQKDMDLLIAVSDQVALALDRKHQQEDLKKEIVERKKSEKITRILFSISNAVSVIRNFDELYKQIHLLLAEIMDATNFFVATIDRKTRTLYFPYYVDTMDDQFVPIKQYNEAHSLTGWVVTEGRAVMLDSKGLAERQDKDGIVGPVPLIWLGAPIIIKGRVVGLMSVQSYTDPELYDEQDLEILSAVCDQVAIAIDRKQAEEKMRESEERYRYLFSNAPSPMFELDLKYKKILNVNKAMCSQSGYTREEFLSINPVDLVTDQSRGRFVEGLKRKYKDRDFVCKNEYEVYRKDGSIASVILNSEFIYKDGWPVGVQIIVHDITERKKMEEMMLQSEKMMSVGGLAAGMAHEINNPLAGIMQNIQVVINRLSQPMPANEKAAEKAGLSLSALSAYMEQRQILTLLSRVHQAGSHAAKIVNNMLSFARKGDASKSLHSIPDLIKKTVVLAQSDYSLKKKYDFKQIRIIYDFEPSVPRVPCEQSKLLQVFFNIIKNAAQEMSQAAQSISDPTLTFSVSAVDEYVRIEISDNGPGMDESVRKRIFEPFFTTKPVDEGTGMGLSLAYFIVVDNHGGEMAVRSTPGKGTTFVIRLPVRIPASDRETRNASS